MKSIPIIADGDKVVFHVPLDDIPYLGYGRESMYILHERQRLRFTGKVAFLKLPEDEGRGEYLVKTALCILPDARAFDMHR